MTSETTGETAQISKAHREVLQMIADRTDDRSPDPGVTTSSSTFADSYNVWVHWRTARALHARGLIEHPFKDPEDGWSIALTDAGWAAIDRDPPPRHSARINRRHRCIGRPAPHARPANTRPATAPPGTTTATT